MAGIPLVAITGANGFLGGALVKCLPSKGFVLREIVRTANSKDQEAVGAIDADTDWSRALVGVHVVIHTAARVHVMNDTSSDSLADFRKVNVLGTANLAWQAAAAGVKRFVFLSSIKVNGEHTLPGYPFFPDDVPAPIDPYGISKMEAEEELRFVASRTGMDVVIIRPPLVYGPGVKANFLNMMKWLSWGVPLPLGAVRENRRSLVALDNLVDLLAVCIDHPAAANQTFLVSDGHDLSTTDLLRRMGDALGRRAPLLPVPLFFLRLAAKVLGRSTVIERLCGSLQVNIDKTRDVLGWTPPVQVDDALKEVAEVFKREAIL